MTGIGVRNGAPSVQAEAHAAAAQAAQEQEDAKVSSLLRSLHWCARTAHCQLVCRFLSSPSPEAEHVACHGPMFESWLVSQLVLSLDCSGASAGMSPTDVAARISVALKRRPPAWLLGGTQIRRGAAESYLMLWRCLFEAHPCSTTIQPM